MKMHRLQISNIDPRLKCKAMKKAEARGLSFSYVRSLINADYDKTRTSPTRSESHLRSRSAEPEYQSALERHRHRRPEIRHQTWRQRQPPRRVSLPDRG